MRKLLTLLAIAACTQAGNAQGIFTSIATLQGWSKQVKAVYADSVTNKIYFAGLMDSVDNKRAITGFWYDVSTGMVDTLPNSQFYSVGIKAINRSGNSICFGGEGFATLDTSGNIVPGKQFMMFDGLQWIADTSLYCSVLIIQNIYAEDSLLFFGGDEFNCTGFPVNKIIKKNLVSEGWFALPDLENTGGAIYAIHRYQGDLYIGGIFWNQSNTAHDLARLVNNQWVDVGGSLHGGFDGISDFIEYNGMLIIAGAMDTAAGDPVNDIGMWDGNQWYSMNFPSVQGAVSCLAVLNGELYAGGNFVFANGARTFAKWDGMQWTAINAAWGPGSTILKMAAYNGSLYLGGWINTINGQPFTSCAKYTPSPAGIKEQDAVTKLTVFPNPVLDKVTLLCPTEWSQKYLAITVYDINGRRVYTNSFQPEKGKVTVNLAPLSAGIYSLLVQDEKVSGRALLVKR